MMQESETQNESSETSELQLSRQINFVEDELRTAIKMACQRRKEGKLISDLAVAVTILEKAQDYLKPSNPSPLHQLNPIDTANIQTKRVIATHRVDASEPWLYSDGKVYWRPKEEVKAEQK